MTWSGAEVALLVYAVAECSIGLAIHGQPRTGRYSFFSNALGWATILFIAWWGGFFR